MFSVSLLVIKGRLAEAGMKKEIRLMS